MSTAAALKSQTVMSPISWSPQQVDFFDWCQNGVGSCVLVAVAGAGKTTCLIKGSNLLKGTVAIMAYNKKVADEIKDKLVAQGIDRRKVEAGTVHSFGFRVFKKHFKARVSGGKLSQLFDGLGLDQEILKYKDIIVNLVSLAKQRGVGALSDADDTQVWLDIIEHFDVIDEERNPAPASIVIQEARALLKKSNETLDIIDFDDMVYLPVLMNLGGVSFDNIIVDEAQDTNATRRALVKLMLRNGGRGIFVGDPKQAIYGFTGADNDSLDILRREFNAIELPLTVTYRCPKNVVQFARKWVSHITAADTAPEGEVLEINYEQLIPQYLDLLNRNSAVLCRNTKPLVKLFYMLLRNRIPSRIEGRDIAAGLKKLATNWIRIKTIPALEAKLAEFLEKEKVKLLEEKKDLKAEQLEDKVEALLTICDACRAAGGTHVEDVLKHIDDMFEDNVEGVMVLSTIHKSKGREWRTVFWLDRLNLCPSPRAKKEWEFQQELHLCYVAATRAMNKLIEVIAPPKEP